MTNANANRSPIVLPSCMDLSASKQLQHDVLARLTDGKRLQIDASRVQSMNLPGVQMILAASRAPNVAIVNPSTAFVDYVAGLSIECPMSFEDVPVAQDSVALADDDQAVGAVARPTRVLAIDDSKTMRDMLRLTLDSAGFDVVQAVDGMDGLDVLTRETVDVIITDINMPKLDGYGVIEQLRSNPIYDATPILVLTTESDTEKKQRARNLGATGFIVKPFDPETLVQVIHKVFPRKQN